MNTRMLCKHTINVYTRERDKDATDLRNSLRKYLPPEDILWEQQYQASLLNFPGTS